MQVYLQYKYYITVTKRAVVSYWRKYVHEVLVNRLGGLSLPRKSVVRLTDRPDMTLDVYRGRKTTKQQQTVTKTGDGTPYGSHGYVLLRFRGNVVMKMGTQQQHNNQDRYVNELVPPRTWTLLGSVWCIT